MKKLSKKQIIIICSAAAVLITAAMLFFIFGLKVTVPNVVGMDINEATVLLEDAGFTVMTLESTDDLVEENKVIFQNIAAFTKLDRSDVGKIILTVSTGVSEVAVPDVIKMSLEDAKNTLTDLGFEVTVTEDYHEDYKEGLVISQSIRARTIANKGSVINIVISKGMAMVQVPDIEGKSVAEAKKLLLNTGIRLKTELKENSSVKEDIVISQSIKAGETVKSNTTLTAVVSIGKINKVGSTPSNSKDFSHIATQGDWIYYIDDGDSGGLYKMRKDGSDLKLLHSGSVSSLNVLGEWVYFSDLRSNSLYRIRIDGTELACINSDGHYWIYVTKDAIYSTNSSHFGDIYKSDIDGNNRHLIFEGFCADVNFYGDRLYFINYDDDHKVYSIDTNGKNQRIEWNDSCSELAVDKGSLYITSIYEIIKLDPKTKRSVILCYEENVQKMYLNISNGWVYFLEYDFNHSEIPTAFSKIKTDGSSYTKIYKFDEHTYENEYINVADGWLYFSNHEDNNNLYRMKTNGKGLEKVVDK